MVFFIVGGLQQSWLRDEIFSGSRIRYPDLRYFLLWARSKNSENPEIPGIGIGNWESRKKLSGDRDRDFKTSRKSRVQNPENIEISGFFTFEIGIFYVGWDIQTRSLFKVNSFPKNLKETRFFE